MVSLGERGQRKTRSIRQLSTLLDPAMAVVAGCAVNDDAFRPVWAACRRRQVQLGLFNLLEAQDVQIKGCEIRLPLEMEIVASASPDAKGRRRSGACRRVPRQQRCAKSRGGSAAASSSIRSGWTTGRRCENSASG